MRGQYFTAHGKINGRDRRADLGKGKKRKSPGVEPSSIVVRPEPTAAEIAEMFARIETRKTELDKIPAPKTRPQIPADGDIVRIIQAAAAVGVDPAALRIWIRRGEFPAAGYVGARVLVSVSALREYKAKLEAEAEALNVKKKRLRKAQRRAQRLRDGDNARAVYYSAQYEKNRAAILEKRRAYYAKRRDYILERERLDRVETKQNNLTNSIILELCQIL